MPGSRDPLGIERRDVEPDDVAAKLRGLLGLPPDEPAPGEMAATFRRSVPPVVSGLDTGGWIAWCLTGLPLFSGRLPPLRVVRGESKRVVVVLAMLRARGCISMASNTLGTARKILRDSLRQAGVYPWRPGDGEQTSRT